MKIVKKDKAANDETDADVGYRDVMRRGTVAKLFKA